MNELTNATRSGTLTVAGLASQPGANISSVSVSVNGGASANADVYADGSWAKSGASLNDGANSYTATATDTYGRTASDAINLSLPSTNNFQYDFNGNLTNDGRRVFEYDYENQLTNVYVASAWRSEFKYDAFGRRRVRKEYTWQSSAWVLTNEVRYLYDGMLVVQERNANNLALVSYTRGNDLSATLQGAGGIGGLLARTDHSTLISQPSAAHAYYHSDGNGNVTAMVDTNGILVAKYNYDPYGNLLGMSGPLAEANTYRFSSKEYAGNAALYYYGFRYYEPNLQRWLNRDPLEELGGMNLFTFCANNTLSYLDIDGLALFGLYDSWGEYFGEVGDVLWGETQGALESLTFGAFKPCYTSELQKKGGAVGEGLAFVGETAAGGYGLWKGLSKKALKEASKQMGKGAKEAFLEELGQKTLKNADFDKLKDLSASQRGKELLKEGKLGLDPRGNWKETMQKGPTPLAALGLGAYGTGAAATTVLNGPTEGDCL